jgi:hypothetical protein
MEYLKNNEYSKYLFIIIYFFIYEIFLNNLSHIDIFENNNLIYLKIFIDIIIFYFSIIYSKILNIYSK